MNKKIITVIALSILFVITILLPGSISAAEKKPPRSVPIKETAINDSNVQGLAKRIDEQLKKNDLVSTLSPSLKINDFAKDVLSSVKTVRTYYEKAINDAATPQNEKENILLKLRRLEEVEKRYNSLYEASTFNLGYIYAKRGDAERGRKYLSEYIKITPFSAKKDSRWMKAKTLLLELYGLEGEF
jgi:tetratricopeptide (TPR) repeat protein